MHEQAEDRALYVSQLEKSGGIAVCGGPVR